MRASLQSAGLTTSRVFADLLGDARGGSAEAIGKLWALCRLRLLATANDEIGDDVRAKAGASDLVQETFLRAQQALDRFSGDTPDELLAWLRTILRNYLANVRRRFHTDKRQVGRELPLGAGRSGDQMADGGPSPGSACIEHEESQRITLAMRRLAADYRRALELRYWQQLSFPEIGRAMGRTAEAARKLWARALVKLQQELDHDAP
jgi:RNA polymerase sigma-70 factor, ECF subfamily